MSLEGGCACRTIRYRLTTSPMIVQACHCRDCQRLTGGPFAINLWIERRFVEGNPANSEVVPVGGRSGKAHDVSFCATCGTILWSRYHIVSSDCLFVRAGTLDTPEAVTPDVHIFTRSKLPWLALPEGMPAFETIYRIDDVWPAESKERLRRNRAEQA